MRRKPRPKGHVILPAQVQKLVTPIHMALTLLPMGLFTASHGFDVVAFLNIAQLASNALGRRDIEQHGSQAAWIVLRLRERAEQSNSSTWAATPEELAALQQHILAIDKWMRGVTNTTLKAAITKALAKCDALTTEGEPASITRRLR